jgi:hypothetical protein
MAISRIIPIPFTDGSTRYLVEVDDGAVFSAGYYATAAEAEIDVRLDGAGKVVMARRPRPQLVEPGRAA